MNIQPSIMVWTVICFLLLMVILKNLLFTPVLRVIDSRREKIQAAARKKADIERLVADHKSKVEQDRLLAEDKARKESRLQLEQIQHQSKEKIECAQRQCLADIQAYRDGIADEHNEIVSSVAPKMETAAALFAKNIITHRI